MIQEIITYIIVAFAFVYAIYGIIKIFIPSKNGKYKTSCSAGCSGCAMNRTVKSKVKVLHVKHF